MASTAPAGFWAVPNGFSPHCYFWDFGTSDFGILGALGSTATFVVTVTILPFMPNGWDPVAGFPAMAGNVPFLMKNIVLLAALIYLLKQDVVPALEASHSKRISSRMARRLVAST